MTKWKPFTLKQGGRFQRTTYRGYVERDWERKTCPHVHNKPETALACAEKEADRLNRRRA